MSTNEVVMSCMGERFIGAGQSDTRITLNGVPGNALGAYLNGSTIVVNGNAQDAVGDTMNEGKIIIHGNVSDALGYAMRGGEIYVKGNAGYRTGIHMKQYGEKVPVIVVGGKAGSFLGEYLAGGVIIVLGLCDGDILGNFTGTGMHGGKIYVRTSDFRYKLPSQVQVNEADPDEIAEYIQNYAKYFDVNVDDILNEKFYLLTPNAKNPYKKMYVAN